MHRIAEAIADELIWALIAVMMVAAVIADVVTTRAETTAFTVCVEHHEPAQCRAAIDGNYTLTKLGELGEPPPKPKDPMFSGD